MSTLFYLIQFCQTVLPRFCEKKRKNKKTKKETEKKRNFTPIKRLNFEFQSVFFERINMETWTVVIEHMWQTNNVFLHANTEA